MQGTHVKFRSLSRCQGPCLGGAWSHYFWLSEVGTGPIAVNTALTSMAHLDRPSIAASCRRPDVGEELCSHHLHYSAQYQYADVAVYISANTIKYLYRLYPFTYASVSISIPTLIQSHNLVSSFYHISVDGSIDLSIPPSANLSTYLFYNSLV